MGTSQFRLPDAGEGLTEAEIVTWRVAAGDRVAVNDVLVEVETAKSLVELPSPFEGVVTALLAEVGQVVAVGAPIVEVETAGSEAGQTEPDRAGSANLVGYGPRAGGRRRRHRGRSDSATPVAEPDATPAPEPESEPAPAPAPAATVTQPVAEPERLRALAKPPVRKLARDLGIELGTVTATGAGGIVTRADVEGAAQPAPPAAPPPEPGSAPAPAGRDTDGRETRLDVTGVRRATAAAMVASAFSAPHVTEWVEVDVTRMVDKVAELRGDRQFREVRVTPLLLVARAVCVALRRTPALNARWDEANQQIVQKHYVNLGIAVDTPRGLVVPNIPGADGLGALELARALGELTETARAGRTAPASMSGGTFTITNIGVFGIDGGTPILNPNEAGILAVGAIREKPWVVGGQIVVRQVTTLAVSFDHRMADGAQGSAFLADVAAILGDPGATLLLA